MKMGTKVAMIGLVAFSGLLQACKVSQSEKNARTVDSILSSDGTSWTRVKTDTRVKGYVVFRGPDNKFYAFNANVVKDGMTKDQFLAAATVYSDIHKDTKTFTEYGVPEIGNNDCSSGDTRADFTCESFERDQSGRPVKIYEYSAAFNETTVTEQTYRDLASGLLFEMGDSTSKDLESVSAAVEALSNNALRAQLVAGYGLSESRATEVAALAKSWQNIEQTRSMTSKDLVEFQSKVFGSDLYTLQKAAVKAANGDAKDYNALIKKAALLNDVSPEQAKAIFKDFVN